MSFREDLGRLKQPELEKEALGIWADEDLFKKCQETREEAEPFAFYEGPPTANGRPGIHHVFSRAIKDMVCRYKYMRGYKVRRKAGWDTHGLPVELEVEKQLGISGKPDIDKYGIGEFNEKCRENIFTYKEEWENLSERIAFWLDYKNAYITCSSEYVESVWWALKRFFDAGLVYQGHKVLPYCPRCGTGLSSHEVSQGYKDVHDPSATVLFQQLDDAGKPLANTYFLAWTTTPWTLLSNVALAVHAEIDYVKVRRETEDGEEFIWVARELAERVFGGTCPPVVEQVKGTALAGLAYARLFSDIPAPDDARMNVVCTADYVTTEDGTGIVHQAAYGDEDWNLIKREGLYPLMAVGSDGHVTKDAGGPWAGLWFKDADKLVLGDLRKRKLLFASQQIKHSYPHCWRDDVPLIYFASPAWYIRTTDFKDRMVELNKEINWVPGEVGEGRFGEWLENNIDWALSRDRFWGTPLPFWVCDQCGKVEAFGSIADLTTRAGCPDKDLDPHRPFVDHITFACSSGDCCGQMIRTRAVADCWFDSGSMPFAQYHYPFANKELFEQDQHPADFIAEGLDQTRGWFYTLHAISTFLFNRPAYRSVVVNGLILDKQGQKMSKRLGNGVDPWEVVDKYGSDPLRYYLIASGQPHLPKRFDVKAVAEVERKVLGTLWNTFRFFAQYANLDEYDLDLVAPSVADRTQADRWILSRLQSLTVEMTTAMEKYDLVRAVRLVRNYLEDELSNWYIRRSRKRFWGAEKANESADKAAAYATLSQVMRTLSCLFAPIMPFSADILWREVRQSDDPVSVHLVPFPEPDQALIDKQLENSMAVVLRLVSLGRQVRAEHNLKVRQPLRRMLVGAPPNAQQLLQVQGFISQVLEELNIKEMETPDDLSSYRDIQVKPNFPVLGRKAGKSMKGIQKALAALEPVEADKVRINRACVVEVDGKEWALSADDLIFQVNEKEGYAVATERGFTVVLDEHLDQDLLDEGLAREVISKVQNLRKETGLELTDRIRLHISGPEQLGRVVSVWGAMIGKEVLAEEVAVVDGDDKGVGGWLEWDLNGIKARINMEKV